MQRLIVRVVLAALALVGAVVPVRADTPSQLPKGYTTDQLPQLPPADPAPVKPANDTVEADAETEASEEYADNDPAALAEFREPLQPYGVWVVDATYGTVWVPSVTVVGADFAPYVSSGHWAMTDDGEWLWVSDYDWGYIPFHYGRWVWISGRGWAWIPGRVYAPAWVVWRVGDGGYIGWAPMPPMYYWSGGVAVSLWIVPPAAYVFCPTSHVFHHHVHHHVIHDHNGVKKAAKATQPYKPAKPKPGGASAGSGSGHKPAEPSGKPGDKPGSGGSASGGGGRSSSQYRPGSPSMKEAGIPSAQGPKSRAAHDSRAVALSKRSTSPSARSMNGMPAARSRGASPPPATARRSPGTQAPASSTPRTSSAPQQRSASPAPRQTDTDGSSSSHSQPRSPGFGSGRGGSSPPPAARGSARPAPRFGPAPSGGRPAPRRR